MEFTWCGKSGKFVALQPPAAAAPAAAPQQKRPSEQVQESKPVTTPQGRHVRIMMERLSSGGTKHEAVFEREKRPGPMSGAERKKKARIKATLWPEQRVEALQQDAERKATERTAAAEEEEGAGLDESSSDGSSESDGSDSADSDIGQLEEELAELVPEGARVPCDNPYPTCSCHFHQVVSELRRLRQRKACRLCAPKCECTVLSEWAACQFRTCFDWNSMSRHALGGTLIRCHTCGTVRCSANCGVVLFNTPELYPFLDDTTLDDSELSLVAIETTIGAAIRDAANVLFDASPTRECTLEELKTALGHAGDFEELQVSAYSQQRVAAAKPQCDAEQELIYTGGKYACLARSIAMGRDRRWLFPTRTPGLKAPLIPFL